MRTWLLLLMVATSAGCASLPAPSGPEPGQTTTAAPKSPKTVTKAPTPARRAERQAKSAKPASSAQVGLAAYIAAHYLISEKGARRIAEAACQASETYRVDARLLVAVMAVESRFNPYAKSRSNAEGLMQIVPRWHPEKMRDIGGEDNVVEVQANVMKGAHVLREYLDMHQQDEALALQQYNGSIGDRQHRYSRKVLREKGRIVSWMAQRKYEA